MKEVHGTERLNIATSATICVVTASDGTVQTTFDQGLKRVDYHLRDWVVGM